MKPAFPPAVSAKAEQILAALESSHWKTLGGRKWIQSKHIVIFDIGYRHRLLFDPGTGKSRLLTHEAYNGLARKNKRKAAC